MSKFRSIKNSFIAGEISPTAFGRTDLPQYVHACKTLRNMIPLLSGGAYRRPGTLFQVGFANATYYVPRVIPFVVSKSESYALIYKQATATGVGSITYIRPIDNMDSSTAGGAVTGTHPYIYASSNTISTTGFYDELHDVQFVQSVDILYLVHPNRKPQRVYRTAVDTFISAEFDTDATGTQLTGAAFRDAWPYQDQNSTATTLTINTATVGSGRTLTASAPLFNSAHVGAVFKVFDGGTAYGSALVTGFTSSTQVTVKVIVAFGDTSAHLTWWESAWSDYRGWPRTVGIYQGRLIYGGNSSERDSLWCSETDDFDQLSIFDETLPFSGPTGTEPFSISLNTSQLNEIQWVSPDKTIAVGTLGDEVILESIDEAGGFKCGNVKKTSQSHFGSSYHQPARVGDELIFCMTSNDEVKSLVFNVIQNSFQGEPVQLLFDHFPKAVVSSFNPNGSRRYRAFSWDSYRETLWCCDTAGNLFGMTRNRALGISAWHQHRMGGFDSTLTGGSVAGGGAPGTTTLDPAYNVCSGSVLSLAVIPNPLNGGNDLWLVVKRKINGAFSYHIERMIGKHVTFESAYETDVRTGMIFTDASLVKMNDYSSPEDYAFAGFSHLEGETPVGTVSQSGTLGSHGLFSARSSVVSSGSLSIQSPYPPQFAAESYGTAWGLSFDSVVEPVRIEAGSQIGTSQGAPKRIHEVTLRFFKTLCAKIGRDASNLEKVIFRDGSTLMGKSPELFTGDKRIKFDGDYDREGLIYILQDKPLPFAVISVIAEGMTGDG